MKAIRTEHELEFHTTTAFLKKDLEAKKVEVELLVREQESKKEQLLNNAMKNLESEEKELVKIRARIKDTELLKKQAEERETELIELNRKLYDSEHVKNILEESDAELLKLESRKFKLEEEKKNLELEEQKIVELVCLFTFCFVF